MSGLALRKNDGEFAEAGAAAMQVELHLHEEGVTLGANVVEVDFCAGPRCESRRIRRSSVTAFR